MKHATRRKLKSDLIVSREGEHPEALTFVISGGMSVDKAGDSFRMPGGLFVGEVAYLNETPSAATTTVRAGSEILQWEVSRLRQISARKDRFRLALEAMISKDLAAKVAVAVAPHSNEWRPQEVSSPDEASSSTM